MTFWAGGDTLRNHTLFQDNVRLQNELLGKTARITELEAEIAMWKRSSATWSKKHEDLVDSFQSHPNRPVIECLQTELAATQAENTKLREALHHISLASQNSMSSQQECGDIANKALAAVGEK